MGLIGIFLIVVGVIGAGAFLLIVLTMNRGGQLNTEKYQSKWMKIERSIDPSQPASFQMAILQTDSLLDVALKESAARGQTMGERMKYMNAKWSNADHVWSAHKIRNRIAHEHDVALDESTTRRALTAFRQALKDLGAI